MRKSAFILSLIVCFNLSAQSEKDSLIFDAYLDTYYGVNLNLIGTDEKNMPPFLFSHHRHNEFNVNLALLNLKYGSERVRANIGLMAGTYANENLFNEPGVLRNIYQGNVGVKLLKEHSLWLDMGILEAHTGFESAISYNQNFLTRSILAENSPYYSTGATINYTTNNEDWYFAGFVLNGWQNMVRPDQAEMPAFGHQVKFMPNKAVTINSSSYVGEEVGINNFKTRIFHNLFAQLESEKTNLIVGFDYGTQQSDDLSIWNDWIGAVFELRKEIISDLSVGGRVEYFYDDNNNLIPVGEQNLFENYGFTLGLDYAIEDIALLRLEAKYYQGGGDYYRTIEDFTDDLFLISFGINFNLNRRLR